MKQKTHNKFYFTLKKSTIFSVVIFSLLMLFSCEPQKPINDKSPHFITEKDGRLLWEMYNQPPKTEISIPDSSNANSAWFSIAEIENYIAYSKREAAKKKIHLSGMRLYFGRYPRDIKKIGGLNTIFFSPTGKFRTQRGDLSNPPAEDPYSQDPDMQGINLLNFGSSGWPPKVEYQPQ